MERVGHFLTWVDYLVIAASLLVCTAVGVFHGRSKTKRGDDSTDYFLGGGNMSILPIAISMLATSMSAVPIVSGVAEMYRFGVEYTFSTIGMQTGKVMAGYLIVPVFKYLHYVSIYKYLEHRFDACMRISFSIIYVLLNVILTGVVLYVPSLLLASVTGFPYWITACISGIVCTAYCTMGGFKTVVWTDVIQFVFMVVSVVIIIARGTVMSGGPSNVWSVAVRDAFFANLTWLDNADKRFTVISSLLFGIFMALQQFSISQAVVQRILSVKSTAAAQRALMITAVLGVLFVCLLIGAASVVYTHFKDCDPQQIPEVTGVKNLDLMFMYAVQIFLKGYPGLSGVVFAGVFSSSLSTISSYLNSFAAITLEDFIKPYYLSKRSKTGRLHSEMFISKCLTAIYGALVILLSFVIPYLGGAMQAFTSVSGSIGGPLTGLMFLAMFVPRATKKACLTGLSLGIALCLWLTIASLMFRTEPQTLPLTTSACHLRNITFNQTDIQRTNSSLFLSEESNRQNRGSKFFLYQISFVWYGPLGIVVTFIVGVIASFIFKPKEGAIDPLLFSPMIQKTIATPSKPLVAKKEDIFLENGMKKSTEYHQSEESEIL